MKINYLSNLLLLLLFMKNFILSSVTAYFFFSFSVNAQKVFTSDVDNFWIAYDKIAQTKDSVLQYKYLNDDHSRLLM